MSATFDLLSERAFVLALALLIDRYVIDPAWLWSRVPHPVVGFGALISAVERRALGRGSSREWRGGILLVVLLVMTSGGIAWLVHAVDLFRFAEVVVVAVLLAQRSLVQHVRAVSEGLERSLADGRSAVSMIVGRDTSEMGEAEVAAAAIESLAENESDGVVAPAFWYLILGPFGIAVYKAVNTADSMVGHLTERHARFGWASARLDDVLNYVPARLTAGMFMVLHRDFGIHAAVASEARLHRSPNAGWPEAALARVAGLRLGGPRRYGNDEVAASFINADGRTPERADIERCLGFVHSLFLLLVASCVVLAAAHVSELLHHLAAWIG